MTYFPIQKIQILEKHLEDDKENIKLSTPKESTKRTAMTRFIHLCHETQALVELVRGQARFRSYQKIRLDTISIRCRKSVIDVISPNQYNGYH